MKRTHLIIRTAIFFAVTYTALAPAQVHFEQVQSSVGLNHNVLYGTTFDFSADPPSLAQMKRVMQRNMGNGAAVGDYDNDGDPDIYVLAQAGNNNRLYRNELVGGQRVFVNVTAIAGVSDLGFCRAAQFIDLDNDGWKDLVVLNDDIEGGTHPPSRVFRNNGDGTFSDQTPPGFAPRGLIKGGMCMGDYAGYGYVGIYVAQWLMEIGEGTPNFAGRNHLYYNHTDGVILLSDDSIPAISNHLQRDSFACAFADFDNDADADLYVAVDHTSDAYYRNNGNRTFTDDTAVVGATHTGNDMGISVADFDNDGDLDVYNTNITDPNGQFGTTQGNTLLVNQLTETGTMIFVDEAAARGVQDTAWGWGTEFVDVDNDGDLDLYAVNGFDEFVSSLAGNNHPLVNAPEVLFINDGSGMFTRSSGTGADFVSDARTAIAFDYNLDGRQDLLVTSILDPFVLLENRTEPRANWLSVELVGECLYGNSSGVGGRVYVTAGGTTQMREVIAGGSYLAGRPLEQHVGLGAEEDVDQLRVVFPDGSEFIRTNPSIISRRVAVFHESKTKPARMIVSKNLRDFASFQMCMGIDYDAGSECELLDTDGEQDGMVTNDDLPWFVTALEWNFLRCVSDIGP